MIDTDPAAAAVPSQIDVVFEVAEEELPAALARFYGREPTQEELDAARWLHVRSGTWSTVRFARRLGRPVHVIMPDGCIDRGP